MTRWPLAIVLLGLIAYLLATVPRLTVFPPIGEDEPWIAAAPYKLATEGVLGSDLFTGYYGMERHLFEQMPLFPLMQAGLFRLFGVGVAQMRALPVACGLLLLSAVFAVGRQLGGDRVGTLAVVLMIALRMTDGGDSTGILLLDRARINRYDIAVPVFALLALFSFNHAERDRRGSWYVLAGLFTGLATLSHLYGLFWLPVFAVLLTVKRGSRFLDERGLWLILAGFAAPSFVWVAYIATGWSDFIGQMRTDAARFNLFDPRFYIENIVYGNGPISLNWAVRSIRTLPVTRVGAWTVLIGTPAAVAVALYRAGDASASAVRSLAVAFLVQLSLFVVFLKVKSLTYMIALWPIAALLLAWLGTWLWDRGRFLARVALATLLGLILLDGGVHVARSQAHARQVTPYDWYESEVAGCIPADSVVLGFQRYWIGLRQYRYRSWLLPIYATNPLYSGDPISLDEALDRLNPGVILVDRHIDDLMTEAARPDSPNHQLHVGFEAFKKRRHPQLTCVIKDHTYGPMQIYLLSDAHR
ncbi:MAG TPA: glycosyltransferase family 39 protein [Vicinamibacterales bacterium]|nr:glycosyltransferase family 39 protein [Vicinamibacterales bacterium]